MRTVLPLTLTALLVSCGGSGSPPVASAPPAKTEVEPPPVQFDGGTKEGTVQTSSPRGYATFDEDIAFLNAHGETVVLTNPEGGKVALSPLYQGRVMTSAVAGDARSLGWINRPFIEAGKTGTQFDNFGGEDRFWLGPEGGQFGLYFPPGKPFTFDAWQTPHEMQEGAWTASEKRPERVVFKKTMTVTNWSKTQLAVDVERTVSLLNGEDVRKFLGTPLHHVSFVGYETKNRIVNAGKTAWTKDKGLPSIWILAMFAPSADARVVIPFEKNAPKGTEIVNDRYFGKVPGARLTVNEAKGFLSFKCDGKERGKIGLGPARAKNVLGSYSAEANLLTIVQYDGPKKGAPYVNSMWEEQKEPYKGDTVNSYNDGPPAPGKPPLGGFYEIETSSPGAELAPGKDLVHTHRTFHFSGTVEYLEVIASKVLGVSLSELGN